MIMTNGDHGTDTDPPAIWKDRRAWMDQWIRGVDRGFGGLAQDRSSVTTFFEMHRNADGVLVPNGRKNSVTFPLEDTRWTNYLLREGGRLTRQAPSGAEAPDSYVSGSPRQSWSYQAGPEFGPPASLPGGGGGIRAHRPGAAAGGRRGDAGRDRRPAPQTLDGPLEDPEGGGGLGLRSRDLMALAQLYANEGQHAGRQVVPAEWVRASLAPSADIPGQEGFEYGYL
jgi:hypothetical protein